jgi:hypothetical protein
VVLIILGGLVPLAVAFSLGKLCFRDAPDVITLGVGAVIESLVIFGLLAAGIAQPPVFYALGALGLAPLIWLCPRLRFPMPGGLPAVIIAVYGVLYLIHTLAPEVQPDAMSYHLAEVTEYAKLGRFPNRVGFFEMLPQGMEMLFLFAFVIGKQSAAKLVEFGFLLATVPLLIELGRRMRLPDYLSSAAAAFYFCAPVVGVTGTSTYNDAALVFFTLATLLALLLGEQYLLPAGLLAGFCYAIKMSGLLVPALAVAFVIIVARPSGCRIETRLDAWRSGAKRLLHGPAMYRWHKSVETSLDAADTSVRATLIVTVASLVSIVPWLIRNAVVAGNPLAPLGNAIFPTQYFHLPMETALAESWRHYDGFSIRTAPWELAVGGKLQGTFGPVFLLLPIGLLALRRPPGRWILLAGALLAIPWFSNAGARFLMPSLPFFALALAVSLDMLARPMLWVCLSIHALTCWPAVAAMYQSPTAWRLGPLPWRAALRLESEQDYLARTVWEYRLTDLLAQTRPSETTFSLTAIPNAYAGRPIVDWWQSALADRAMDTLRLASVYSDVPFFDLRAEWPAEALNALRFRLTTPHPGEWDLNEVRLFSGSDRVNNSPRWLLTAWPNPWEVPVAFDDNLASRWRTWEPMRPGMFVEVRFDHPERLTAAALASHSPIYNVPVEFYGLGSNGAWKLLSAHPERVLRPKEDLRRPAMRYLKSCGIDYILAPVSTAGVWQLGKILVEQHREWGLEDVGQRGPVHLLRIQR